jgi:hypothetical protein
LNLKLCIKQYNKIELLHLIVVPQLSGGWQHNHPTKTRQASSANEQSMYSLMSILEKDIKNYWLATLLNRLQIKMPP